MLSPMYGKCPICGVLHDDGVIFSHEGKHYFICFDCSEGREEREIIKCIENKQNQ